MFPSPQTSPVVFVGRATGFEDSRPPLQESLRQVQFDRSVREPVDVKETGSKRFELHNEHFGLLMRRDGYAPCLLPRYPGFRKSSDRLKRFVIKGIPGHTIQLKNQKYMSGRDDPFSGIGCSSVSSYQTMEAIFHSPSDCSNCMLLMPRLFSVSSGVITKVS